MEVGGERRRVPPRGAAKVYACVRWCRAQLLERREQAGKEARQAGKALLAVERGSGVSQGRSVGGRSPWVAGWVKRLGPQQAAWGAAWVRPRGGLQQWPQSEWRYQLKSCGGVNHVCWSL